MHRIAVLTPVLLAMLTALVLGAPADALAAKRVALVIGNDSYSNLAAADQLLKARNDATAVAQSLEALGFDVAVGLDLARSDINRKLQDFANKVEPGDTAAFFFAGHGVRIGAENYLLPADVPPIESGQEEFLKSEAVRVDRIVSLLASRGARISLLILDACRNNPFTDARGRSIGGARGLARVDPPEGTFVMFSAGAGQVALDRLTDADSNPNSVFTRKLLPLMSRRGLEINALARQLKQEVRTVALDVGHKQTPAVYNEVIGDFFLAGAGDGGNTPAPPAGPSLAQDFQFAKDIGTKDAWEAFLTAHGGDPDNLYVQLARAALKKLAIGVPPEDPGTGTTPPEVPHEPETVTRAAQVWPVGKWPEGMAIADKSLWVAESGQRRLARIDPRNGKVVKRFKVGRLPVGVVSTSNGDVYTYVATDKHIWRRTSQGKRQGRFVRLRDYPQAMVGDDGALWVLSWIDGSSAQTQVIRIDLNTGKQRASAILPSNGFDLKLVGDTVWVMHRLGNENRVEFIALDKQSLGEVRRASVPGFTSFMAADANGVFASGGVFRESGLIVRIDPATGRETARNDDLEHFVGQMAVDGEYLIAVDYAGVIRVLSADDLSLIRSITLDFGSFEPKSLLVRGNNLAISTHRGQGDNGSVLIVSDWKP